MNEDNIVINNDCLTVLKEMSDECVDLIYLDPPFFTQRTHCPKTRNG